VGTSGGESTQSAFGRSDLKNGANDAAIGGEDEKEAAEGHETHPYGEPAHPTDDCLLCSAAHSHGLLPV